MDRNREDRSILQVRSSHNVHVERGREKMTPHQELPRWTRRNFMKAASIGDTESTALENKDFRSLDWP